MKSKNLNKNKKTKEYKNRPKPNHKKLYFQRKNSKNNKNDKSRITKNRTQKRKTNTERTQ